MSMNRVCPICYREEGVRLNFGNNRDAEAEFHRQHWCDCGYSSTKEMMQDQDLGFVDSHWVEIVKYFLNEYYLRIAQGSISTKDEHIRFFLKLLKSSASNYRLSIELKLKNENEDFEYIYDGKPKKKPRKNIFDNTSDLEHFPERVVLDTLNDNLLNSYNQAQLKITELKKNDIKKNQLIASLIVLLIVVGVIAIF